MIAEGQAHLCCSVIQAPSPRTTPILTRRPEVGEVQQKIDVRTIRELAASREARETARIDCAKIEPGSMGGAGFFHFTTGLSPRPPVRVVSFGIGW